MTHTYFGKLRARSAAPGLCRLVGLLFVGLLSASPRAAEIVSLTRFNASGRGDVTTTASVVDGGSLLTVADATTWLAGHGVRVTRAGDDTRLHHADFGWSPPPDALPGTAVAHDGVDKVEGAASVQCTFAGQPPDANGDGLPDPVELCEIDSVR